MKPKMFPISGSNGLYYHDSTQTVGDLHRTLFLNISDINNNGYGAPALTKCPTISKHQTSYQAAHTDEDETVMTACPGVRAHFTVESDGSMQSVEAPGFYLQFGGLRLDTKKYGLKVLGVPIYFPGDDDPLGEYKNQHEALAASASASASASDSNSNKSMTTREKIIVGVTVAVGLVAIILSNIATLKYTQRRERKRAASKK